MNFMLNQKLRLLWHLIALVVMLLLSAPALAQEDTPAAPTPQPVIVPRGFESPSATLLTFVVAMDDSDKARDITRAVQCMDISGIVPEAARELAAKLFQCIDRIEYIDFDRLTGPGPEETSWTFYPREIRFLSSQVINRYNEVQGLAPDASIVLTRQANGAWRFSAETVAGIDDFRDRIRSLERVKEKRDVKETLTVAQVIESFWPVYFADHSFLRIKYWQWISLGAMVFFGVLLDYSVRFLLIIMSKRMIARRGGEASHETLKRTVRPFGLAAAALLWLFGISLFGLPVPALKFLVPAVKFFAILAVVWAAYRLTDLISEVLSGMAAKTESKFDDLLIPLLRKTVKIIITVFGFIYLADSLDVPLAPLLTGIGIGGAGFAFAAKDTVEHFFGSLTVIADRPFQVGDWVVIGDTEGTVEVVGFRSTRIRTFYNSLVTVPNGTLVRAVVDNFGERKYRRWTTHLNLTYDTSPEKIDAMCQGVRELIRLHPYTRKDYYQVWMHQMSAHSLDVLVYVFFETPDWQTELRERHRLILDIIRLADQLGVKFAFPTQTLHMYKEEPSNGHTPSTVPGGDAYFNSKREGIRAVHSITAQADWRTQKPSAYVFEESHDPGAEDDDEKSQIESKIGGNA